MLRRRWILTVACVHFGQFLLSQEEVAFGLDVGQWMGGWRQVQMAVAVQEELQVHVGLGALSEAAANSGFYIRPRPLEFERAWSHSIGLRVYPKKEGTSALGGMLGLDVETERFRLSSLDPVKVPGSRDWIRSDLRLLAGGVWRPLRSVSIQVYAALGRSRSDANAADLSTAFGPKSGQNYPRMIGAELWYSW